MQLFTPEKLVDKIDGAATPYVNRGMQFAMYQILDGFGSDANAAGPAGAKFLRPWKPRLRS